MGNKTKIVLDADVIIHFIKAGQFSLLLNIFPEYQYLLLDVVYDEVTKNRETKTQIDNTLQYFSGRISPFPDNLLTLHFKIIDYASDKRRNTLNA